MTKNLKVKVMIGGRESEEVWNNYLGNITQEQAEQEAHNVIDAFNRSESQRYGDKAIPRTFVSVEIVDPPKKASAPEDDEEFDE